jgi:histidinol-phosphatase
MPEGWRTIVARAWSNRGLGDFWQHCLVAEGALDVACDAWVAPWDWAATRLIVEEASGRVSSFDGGELVHGGSYLSTNGALHDEVVRLLGA